MSFQTDAASGGWPRSLHSHRFTAAVLLLLLLSGGLTPGVLTAQTHGVVPGNLAQYTAPSPYPRFADGRPKVPDALIQEMRAMKLEVEEAWGVVRARGYMNQYDANWRVLQPETRLIGRALTVQFMPTRPDLADALQQEADARGIGRLRNQTAIDMLQRDDVAVVDLFGKVDGGTFVGDKLAYYVQKVTGTGLVVDGALFYLNRLEAAGMPAYYRGTHPSSLTGVVMSGVNVPVRIGQAIVMPGDIVLGDRDGILFIPPHLVEEVIASAKTQRARDAWVKGKFDLGKYKSSEIYGQPTDPALLREMQDYIKRNSPPSPTPAQPPAAPAPAPSPAR